MSESVLRVPTIRTETARGIDACTLEDKMFDRREVVLQGEVNSVSCNQLILQLMYLDREEPGEEITLYINSPGGEINSGMALYDAIRMLKSPVRTVCMGMAASMGALLFLAGDKRELLPHSEIMIHDPRQFGGGGVTATDIASNAERIMKMREMTGRIIAERTGKDLETVLEYTKTDSWFEAQEAIEFGLATGIVESF